jgi:hypothetical protein
MSKNIQNLFKVAFAFIVIVIGNYVIVAQSVVTGDWKAEYKAEKADKIQLNFSRRSENGRNQMGQSYELKDLQGLSLSQITGADSSVRFSLVREAGNVECEGKFTNGRGSGTFRFVPNPQFISAMKSRGFDFENTSKGDTNIENKLFAAATLNVTTALADDLLSADFGKLDVDDLFKAAIFKIDGKFAREMKDSGFQGLTFDDLVKARIFKIDAAFVREVAQMGFQNEPFETLVKMRIFKVTPEFIAEIRGEGFNNLDIEDLVKMRIFKIDGAFIRQARSEGVPMNVEKLVQKKIGVYRKDN